MGANIVGAAVEHEVGVANTATAAATAAAAAAVAVGVGVAAELETPAATGVGVGVELEAAVAPRGHDTGLGPAAGHAVEVIVDDAEVPVASAWQCQRILLTRSETENLWLDHSLADHVVSEDSAARRL